MTYYEDGAPKTWAPMGAQSPAIRLLRSNGYEVRLIPSADGAEGLGDWTASKDDVVLVADDPLALLGFATVFDEFGHSWRQAEVGSLWEDAIRAGYGKE